MFIILPVGMNYRTERLPVVTFWLIGINVAVWLISMICFFATEGETYLWEIHHCWLIPATCTWYAPLTSMFEHAGPFHLAGNMIFLFLFGACVEDMIGRLRFFIFYLVGGFFAEFFYLCLLPEHFHSSIPMCGASGAISAAMGMYVLLRAHADIELKYFVWIFWVYIRAGSFEVAAWVAIALWFACQLFSAALQLILGSGGQGGVAFGAHIGGFLAGMAMLAISKKFSPPRVEEAGENSPAPVASRTVRPIIDTSAFLATARTPPAAMAISTTETPTIFLHDGHEQTGPYTLTAVQAMLNNGEISRDTSYWSEGMSAWESVVELSDHPLD